MKHELIGLNPGNLSPLYTGDRTTDSSLEAVAGVLRFAAEVGEKIGDLALTLKADKDLSHSGRIRKFREQEPKLREPALAKLDAAKALVEDRVKGSQLKMSAPLPPESEEGVRREDSLIAALRAMKSEERAELNSNDDEVAGAILRSHHLDRAESIVPPRQSPLVADELPLALTATIANANCFVAVTAYRRNWLNAAGDIDRDCCLVAA